MNSAGFDKPMRCHYCKNLEPPMVEPTQKKRIVLLACARCGNSMCVRYVPKTRKQKHEAPDDH